MQFRRGDTFKFKFQRLDSNKEVITQDSVPADIYFTVKYNTYHDNYCFQKKLIRNSVEEQGIIFGEDNYYHVTINPNDTNGLQFGNYNYDIEIVTNNYKKTIAVGTLTLLEEVTFASNETNGG